MSFVGLHGPCVSSGGCSVALPCDEWLDMRRGLGGARKQLEPVELREPSCGNHDDDDNHNDDNHDDENNDAADDSDVDLLMTLLLMTMMKTMMPWKEVLIGAARCPAFAACLKGPLRVVSSWRGARPGRLFERCLCSEAPRAFPGMMYDAVRLASSVHFFIRAVVLAEAV